MMTGGQARVVIDALAAAEAKNGRQLQCDIQGGWTFCPVCSSRDRDFSLAWALREERNEKTGIDGYSVVFYIRHGAAVTPPKTCLMIFAGQPAPEPLAENLRLHGEALAVLGIEELMAGGKGVM